MGVLPTPNHLALIRDCYPPHNSTNSESELPRPVSNAVSKLAFYAVNRPAKLPKVVAALTDRAARATGGTPVPTSSSSSSTAHAHPVKNRIELAVTCEIFRTLVIECAESGNQGSAELVKSALAEPALSVADMALGGGGGGGGAGAAKNARDANTRPASPTLRRPDAELEARGASLFHAVATMTTPPFFGFGLAARQYQRCLATLSARVQLTGAADHTDSRYVALKALEGAARSDIMFATGSDFDRQVGQVAPALFCTCLASSPSELEDRLLESDSLSPLPPSLRSRKAAPISPPSSSPSEDSTSSKAPPPVSQVAVYSLAHLSRHSTVPQLLVIHSNFLSYLEEHASAPLTRSPDDVASESSSRGGPAAPAIAKTLLTAAPEPHRSPALSWWADRAAESTDPGRTIALLEILQHLVVGLAAPASPQKGKADDKTANHRPVSLNASGILNTLAEMVVVRSSLAESASDPVVDAIYSTLAALVETSDRIGYPSQLDDLASETITLLAALSQADEHEFPVEEFRIERLTAGMDGAAKARARGRLLVILKMLVEPARAAGVAASIATRIDQQLEEPIQTTVPSTLEPRPAVADNSVGASRSSPPPSSSGVDVPKQDTVVPQEGAATTTAAAAVTAVPGLPLGAPIERGQAGVVETAESSAATNQQAEEEGAQDPAQPIFLVHPPSSGHLDSIATGGGGGRSDGAETHATTPLSSDRAADAHTHAHAHALSPYTVSRSLFLLSDSYPPIRSAYLDFLITFLRQLSSRTTEEEEANKAAAETDAFWRKFAVEFHAAAGTATATATATSPAEETEMIRLAEAAFSIQSGSALLACLPMLLSQLQAPTASGGPTIAKQALSTLARTWHVKIPATTADIVVDAFASDAGVQAATRRDRAQLVEMLSTRWVYGTARLAAASSLSPYLTGAPPARSLVQLGISRSRAGSTLRLSSTSASASAAASAPRTPPSLARSGSGSGGSGHGHSNGHAPGDAAHAYSASGGLSKGTPTTRTSLDSSLSPSAYLARRLRQQTPSLADLQAAAATSPVHDSASSAAPGNGSPRQQSSVVSSLVGAESALLGSSRVGEEDQRSTSRRTGRESVESLLERVGRRSARRGV